MFFNNYLVACLEAELLLLKKKAKMSSDGLVENTRLAPLGAEIAFCTAHCVFMAVIVSRLADLEGSVGGMYPSIQGVSLGSKEP